VTRAVDGTAAVIGYLRAGRGPGRLGQLRVPAIERKPKVSRLSRSRRVTTCRRSERHPPLEKAPERRIGADDDRSDLASHRTQISPLCMETAIHCLRPMAAQSGGFASPIHGRTRRSVTGAEHPSSERSLDTGRGLGPRYGRCYGWPWPFAGSWTGSIGRSSCLRSGTSGTKLCPSAGKIP